MNVGSNDTCQWHLRSKIGVWQMPLFKFLRHGDLKVNFKSTGRRDLNIKYTNFDWVKYWECHSYEYSHYECVQCNYICENGEHILTGEQKPISITWEEQTVYYLYWGNDTHTKVNTVNYFYWGNDRHTTRIPSIIFIGIMTNIWKKILSIIFTGIMTNIRKKYCQLSLLG